MNAFKRLAVVALLALPCAGPAAATDYYVAEGQLVNHGDLKSDDDLTAGVRGAIGFELASSDWGQSSVEIGVFGGPIERAAAASGAQLGFMVHAVQAFDLGWISPYMMAGLGPVLEENASGDPALQPAIEGGLGVLLGNRERTRLRLGGSVQTVFNDRLAPAVDSFTDYRVVLGLLVPIGAKAASAMADSDGDGVTDDQDRCPAQAAPTADGCPAPLMSVDSDGDGIPDGRDECPGTLAGLNVDASGCVAKAGAQTIVLKGVNFLSGSTELTSEARSVLDEAAASLAGQSNLRVEVGGYTDSRGNDKANLALSQRRAEAVRQYLLSKGVAAERLTARGYGETRPIADNATREGRLENRRVELKILD